MTAKKKTPPAASRRRLEVPVHFKAEREWIEKVDTAAGRLGINRSGLIRQAVNRYLEQLDRERGE